MNQELYIVESRKDRQKNISKSFSLCTKMFPVTFKNVSREKHF